MGHTATGKTVSPLMQSLHPQNSNFKIWKIFRLHLYVTFRLLRISKRTVQTYVLRINLKTLFIFKWCPSVYVSVRNHIIMRDVVYLVTGEKVDIQCWN